jgi:hypothetical protein
LRCEGWTDSAATSGVAYRGKCLHSGKRFEACLFQPEEIIAHLVTEVKKNFSATQVYLIAANNVKQELRV